MSLPPMPKHAEPPLFEFPGVESVAMAGEGTDEELDAHSLSIPQGGLTENVARAATASLAAGAASPTNTVAVSEALSPQSRKKAKTSSSPPSTPPEEEGTSRNTLFKRWLQRVVHKISPRRGRSVNPKKKDLAHQAWELRNEECNGLVLVSRANEDGSTIHSGRCSLCKKKTNMYCTGCKRFLCVDKNRTNALGVDLTNICDPSTPLYKFEQTQIDQKTGEQEHLTFYATRSCYHMVHEAAFDRLLRDRPNKPSEFDRLVDPNEANLLNRFERAAAASGTPRNIIPTYEE